jgi:hypothetical protein
MTTAKSWLKLNTMRIVFNQSAIIACRDYPVVKEVWTPAASAEIT